MSARQTRWPPNLLCLSSRGAPLTAFDRRLRLLRLMRSDPALRVPMIAQALGVSEGTVRNDLNALAEERRIIRVRGGGVVLSNNDPPSGGPRNAAFATRAGINEAAKRQIGRRAAELVEDGDALLLDASS